MSERRDAIVARALTERDRQYHLPGSEWDARHQPNDWLAIAASYLLKEPSRKGAVPTREDFEDTLVKALAVIIAALEHAEAMQRDRRLA